MDEHVPVGQYPKSKRAKPQAEATSTKITLPVLLSTKSVGTV